MSALNSVILEGEFQHFTSKKGEIPLRFLIKNNGQSFGISVPSKKMADVFVSKKVKKLRLVGKLDHTGRTVVIQAEHIDYKA